MDDLRITRLCAEAMGLRLEWLTGDDPHVANERGQLIEPYDPLHDDAQAMALVKKFRLCVEAEDGGWLVKQWSDGSVRCGETVLNENLNRAICECVAKMQEGK